MDRFGYEYSKERKVNNLAKKDQAKQKRKQQLAAARKRQVRRAATSKPAAAAGKQNGEAVVQKEAAVPLDQQQAQASSPAANRSVANEQHQRTYRQLQQACAKSKHITTLRQQDARLWVELPEALPSTLLLRALQRNDRPYKALSAERLAEAAQQPAQLELDVHGLADQQLETFIEELDELIGEFTGRS